MGLGGAMLYSLARTALRQLPALGALAARLLRGVWQAFLDGAVLHAASIYGMAYFQEIERIQAERRTTIAKSSEK